MLFSFRDFHVAALSSTLFYSALCIFTAISAFAADPSDDQRLIRARSAAAADAVPLYKELARDYPGSAVIWYELGSVLSETSAWEEALAALQQPALKNYRPAATQSKIGRALAKLKRYREAEAAYRGSLELEPQSIGAQFGLGAALFSQNKSAEALPIFERLSTRIDEWAPVAREYLAQIYFDLNRFQDSANLSRELLTAAPENHEARWLLARSLFKLREYEPALSEFRAVAQNDPARNSAATYYVAASLEGLGRTREAEDAYAAVDPADPVWHQAARDAKRSLAGKSWHFTLDETVGYETGIVRNDDIAPVEEKDGYNELFLSVLGRVHRGQQMSLWLGVDHYSLNYFRLHENDYSQETAKVELRFVKPGPLKDLTVRYRLQYAEFDYQPYQLENILESYGTYEWGPQRLRFGAFINASEYFRQFDSLSGPVAGGFLEYRRRLPLWDHELQTRVGSEYRFSEASELERSSSRIALQYRAQIWKCVYGQLRTQYRRDDFPESRIGRDRRVDHRLTGEAEFDAPVRNNLSINWGYLYESQDSRLNTQEYGRHQISAGFTLRF